MAREPAPLSVTQIASIARSVKQAGWASFQLKFKTKDGREFCVSANSETTTEPVDDLDQELSAFEARHAG